jgi:hypothetical protein
MWPYLLLSRQRGARECYITCTGRVDGVGCQIQAVLSTMLFAHLNGLTYVHTPFREIGQRVEKLAKGRTEAGWEQKWEEFLNLGSEEVQIGELEHRKLKHLHIKPLALNYAFPRNTLYIARHCNLYANAHADRYMEIQPRIREKYFSSSKREFEVFRNPNKMNIAVHVRRGEIKPTGKKSKRYTENEKIARALSSLVEAVDRARMESDIYLFSLGEPEDFGTLTNMDIHFNLNTSTFSTFHSLMTADVLLMAKSYLSFCAGIYSKGLKIHEDGLHEPLSNWIRMEESGRCDVQELANRLHILREAGDAAENP